MASSGPEKCIHESRESLRLLNRESFRQLCLQKSLLDFLSPFGLTPSGKVGICWDALVLRWSKWLQILPYAVLGSGVNINLPRKLAEFRMIQWLSPSVLKVSYEASNLDVELRNFALKLWQDRSPGLSRSNRGGWHSRYLDGNNNCNASAFSELSLRVKDVAMLFLQKWPFSSSIWRRTRVNRVHFGALWVNVHQAGDYNVEHQHAEIGAVGDEIPLLSGVYYPQGPTEGAKLHLDCHEGNEGTSTKLTQDRQCRVDPDPGTLVIFPATLLHSVEPAGNPEETGDPRVSFAFNLILRQSASKLHRAAMEGNSSEIQDLCQRSDINAKDLEFGGFTSLHHAAEAGHLSVLQVLLENRADPFAQSNQLSLPVHLAAEAGHLKVVKELLKSTPNLVNKTSGSQNRTLMHLAAANGKVDLLMDLLNFQADFQLLQADGSNALHASVQNGHLAATDFLLHHFGSLVNGRDVAQHQPAHEAARGGHEAILRRLVRASADVTGKGLLGGGCKHFMFSPRTVGKWSNLTNVCQKRVETTN